MTRRRLLAVLLGLALAVARAPLAGDGAKADMLHARIAADGLLPRDFRVWGQPAGLRRELLCVATNSYFEARGEPLAGRLAVSLVVRNRSGRDASTLCAVVWAPLQFSWTARPLSGLRVADAAAWGRAQDEACDVVLDGLKDFTGGATHFYAPRKVSPAWAKRAAQAQQIGSHRFLRLSRGEALVVIPVRSLGTWM